MNRARMDGSPVSLSDYRLSRIGHGAQNSKSQFPPGGVNSVPDLQKLELARLICELAESWDVDLSLVVAVAAGLRGPSDGS